MILGILWQESPQLSYCLLREELLVSLVRLHLPLINLD